MVIIMDSPILYDDKNIVVCIKSPGLLSEEGGMPELLSAQRGGPVWCVHRLDRAVGGIMVYAADRQSAAKLSALIAQGGLEKRYLAVVSGCPEEESGTLKDLLFRDRAKNKSYVVKRMRRGVKDAELGYQVLGRREGMSLLDIQLVTGRSHQIRVQFSSRGMPLLGDVKYGSAVKSCNIALWSHSLCFPHPVSGERMHFTAPPPALFPWTEFDEWKETKHG